MPDITFLLILTVILALVFDYINGFHDTANAIATVVSTRVLSPRVAIFLAASLNFAGALVAEKVAKTIAKGIIVPEMATETVVLGAIVGAIVWNLITWVYGIPSSSSHALVGGLVGAGIASGGLSVVTWDGLLDKVIYPLIGSPIVGFVIGFIIMNLIAIFFAHSHAQRVGSVFKKLQVVSSSLMAFAHGQNDAQKSMGIITLALVTHGFVDPNNAHVPLWVKLSCAAAMALGTAAGGWRIMHTVGQKISRLEPVHGFAAETSGAMVILAAGFFGMPISTTHTITTSIFGVASARRFSAVRWSVAQRVVIAWVLTIPASAAVAAGSYWVFSQIWK
ncbi:MAG: inorganic phosphate transporter [Fimbriimonadaceae bacterium]|nr:inorganic phosphate transporter [Fimbriimonadaceae bacterium]